MKFKKLYGCLLITMCVAVISGGCNTASVRFWAKDSGFQFFVFDNGVGRGKWTPQEQASALKELGYDGISYNYTNNEELEKRIEAFKAVNLRIFGLYCGARLDKTQVYDPKLKDAFQMLKGSNTIIWWTLIGGKSGAEDEKAIKIVREIADLAGENGLQLVLYPHAGFYVATSSDAVRIVKQVNRSNVGASLNLCHEFLSKKGDCVPESIKEAVPYLRLVSINGIDTQNKKYLLRLDQGDYDVTNFLRMLKNAGYNGPIGLQCYSVPGDQKANLKENITTWRKIREKVFAEVKSK
ncbi:MAG: sugar phosphate isomerase/epimerase [Kiritimatiellae bacterium]|nr:sugar phosphate isomerase/epimerase [Kiritimatiellia bacterium]MDD5522901.1 sugar phosphate isomerase/epimerase [Kiritimatiellia bacterium]